MGLGMGDVKLLLVLLLLLGSEKYILFLPQALLYTCCWLAISMAIPKVLTDKSWDVILQSNIPMAPPLVFAALIVM